MPKEISETDQDALEVAYDHGSRRAWLMMFTQCLKELGRNSREWNESRWVAEREEIVLALRSICAEHGDNDWPDDLHLADVLNKHLLPYLDENLA